MKLVPRTLEAMPVIEDGGKTYVCHVRKGIFFTPDAAFKGKPRELTAADYAYGIKRLLDPGVKSPWIWLVEGKIAGSAEAIAQAAKTGRFDYAAPMPGLEVVDRYTLKIRLTQPDLRFIYVLAIPNVSAVAHEVVEMPTGIDFGAHPVGTGPYVLGTYNRSAKIMLDANPGFRERTYAPSGPIPAESQAIAAGAQGSALPLRGTHRNQRHRGGAGEVACISQPRARHPGSVAVGVRRRGACRRQSFARRWRRRASSTSA